MGQNKRPIHIHDQGTPKRPLGCDHKYVRFIAGVAEAVGVADFYRGQIVLLEPGGSSSSAAEDITRLGSFPVVLDSNLQQIQVRERTVEF